MQLGPSTGPPGSAAGIWELVAGPFDGGHVSEVDGKIPRLIFLGPRFQGDYHRGRFFVTSLAAGPFFLWSEAGSASFTCRYSHHNGRFHFAGYW